MKNHLGIVVGITMLVAAAAVYKTAIPGEVLKGELSWSSSFTSEQEVTCCLPQGGVGVSCGLGTTCSPGQIHGGTYDSFDTCSQNCNIGVSSSTASCPGNCVAGYTGSCDPDSCTQDYNVGECVSKTSTLCALATYPCEDRSLCTSSSSSSSSSSTDVCGGTCGDYGLCCDGVGECTMCSSSSSSSVCRPNEEDCGTGVCCSYENSYCSDDGTYCVPFTSSSSFSSSESCEDPDYNPPSCSNENNPPPFSTCGKGYHIEDLGCQEGSCGCTESTSGPQIRCQHKFICKKD